MYLVVLFIFFLNASRNYDVVDFYNVAEQSLLIIGSAATYGDY